MAQIKSFALGGLDEIGKNSFVIEVNQDIFVFDFGLKILKEVDFGINSLIPDFNYLLQNQKRIKGVFISKIDIGNAYGLKFLLQKIPHLKIFVSKISQELLKNNTLLTKQQFRDNVYVIGNQPIKFNENFIHCFYTASNLPGSCGFSLETLDGYIIYTGSFILETGFQDELFTTQIKNILLNPNKTVLLLITNATQLAIKSFITPTNQVDKWFKKVSAKYEHKLFICCEENDWYKIFQIIKILNEMDSSKFKISFFDQDFANKFKTTMHHFKRDIDLKKISKINILETDDEIKQIIFLTGNQKWLFSRVLRLINNKNTNLKLTKKDCILILGEGQFIGELSIFKTLNELHKTEANIEFIGKNQIIPMEAGFEDVKLLINFLRPKYLFPTNAYHKDLEIAKNFSKFINITADKIFIKENGEVITFKNQEYVDRYEAIEIQSIFVDNLSNININESVINDRRLLSEEGILFVSFSYQKEENFYLINSKIEIMSFGLTKEEKNIKKINDEIKKEIHHLFKIKGLTLSNPENLTQLLKRKLVIIIKKILNKNPFIFPIPILL